MNFFLYLADSYVRENREWEGRRGERGVLTSPNLKPETLIAIGRGEGRALERLYRDWKEKIFYYIYYRVGDREVAQDILQEVFLAIWKSASSYRNEAAPRTWVFSLVRFKISDFFRAQKKQERARNASQEALMNWEQTNQPAAISEVFSALEKLEPRSREIFLLIYYLGFNYQEAAAYMDIPVGTVKSKIFYGKKKLQAELEGGP